MSYKAKKLVSVRLDAHCLQVIDDWAKKEVYRKRSDVVDAAVALASWMIQNGYAEKLLLFFPERDTVDEFKLEYHRQNF